MLSSALLVVLAVTLLLGRGSFRAESTLPAPPDDPGQTRAVAEHLAQKYDEARRAPRSIRAVGDLCLAYHADMYFDQAEGCYAVAAELDPGAWRLAYLRALIQAERGGGEDLVASLKHVLQREPQFAPAWLRLGDAEFKAGRYGLAGDAWRRARALPEPPPDGEAAPRHVREVPLAAYASLGLARIALMGGDAAEAERTLLPVIMAAPDFGAALRLLAESYRALGRHAEAERAVYRAGRRSAYTPYADPMMDALARESRNSTFLLRLASEANLSVNAEWSEYLTRRAVEFDPDNPEAVVKLGRVLRTVGRNEEALQLFQRYQRMVPGDFQALAHIGSCLSALGRYAEAEWYFRQALAGLDDPVSHFNLGLLMAVTGRSDEAIAEYERALDRDPQHSDARINLAVALARRGAVGRASRELLRVLDHDPENAVAHANLGLVLIQQGRAAEAARALETALSLDPRLEQAAEALRVLRGDP